ncbi:hypothetical protein [Paenarthrobacter ilicis]|uniref:hypothetical protein n=1 Tax=Paenarthrobacter ilicis TaxID=43665 RepID=UPI0028D383D8|nr:hypothetical protein [Paenarthrobacter ilicis]
MNKRAAGMARSVAAAVPAALFVALAGTALHRQAVDLSGVVLPWGVAAALLLLASVELWLAAWSRSLVSAAVAGVVTYAAVGLLSSAGTAKRLVLGDAVGNVWVFGIGVVTLVTLAVVSRLRFGLPAAVAAEEPPSPR